MSRIIVKNLPSNIKEDRLRSLFSQKGTITDCCLKYTKDGVFRKFAFIGYSDPAEAASAVLHFNKSFIDTSRLSVEVAQDIADASKPKAWSKYTKEKLNKVSGDSAAATSSAKTSNSGSTEVKKPLADLLASLKHEPEFRQFLAAHKNKSQKALWINDEGDLPNANERSTEAASPDVTDMESAALAYAFEGESDSDSDADDTTTGCVSGQSNTSVIQKKSGPSTSAENPRCLVNQEGKPTSDMEYLRSKVTSRRLVDSDDDGAESDDTADFEKPSAAQDGGGECEVPTSTSMKSNENRGEEMFTVKLRGLPHNFREKQIKEFLMPLTPTKIGVPRNANRQTIGIAFVSFVTEKDFEQALRKTRTYVGTNKVFVSAVKSKEDIAAAGASGATDTNIKPRPWETKAVNEAPESIGESGQLYVRNLAYVCKEEDLEKLFGKYGPLTEVNLPIDKSTKKVKGFAHITYMLPEHAVRAFSELDGTTFQGRILHILPGRSVHSEDHQTDASLADGSNYKKKKEAEQKKTASSSHNWNALFLGSNAVADVMAEKYGVKKSDILNADLSQSLGVRMALGETQIVAETREFLLTNGVVLDSFSQPTATRSRTVILVKNLPASTSVGEITEIFAKFGSLGRVLLPPHGITAIVEFVEPSEARAAFSSLAYTRFKDLPLYLEWAPTGIFSSNTVRAPEKGPEDLMAGSSDDEEASQPSVEGATLFVKNLNLSTTENALAEHFSSCGKVRKAEIARKKDVTNGGKLKSMGYGFVEFADRLSAQNALKEKQHSVLDGQELQLKVSERTSEPSKKAARSLAIAGKSHKAPKTTKILVRNVPFEANRKEVAELFKVFGELKYVRLPKKVSGTGKHRGFAFVDFLTRADAKKAFNALCHSTHLYGRRLVLEWADADSSVDELRLKTAEHFHEGGGQRKKLKKQQLIADLKAAGGPPGETDD